MQATPRQPECAEPRRGDPDRGTIRRHAERLERQTESLLDLQDALDEHAGQAEADAQFDRATGEGRR